MGRAFSAVFRSKTSPAAGKGRSSCLSLANRGVGHPSSLTPWFCLLGGLGRGPDEGGGEEATGINVTAHAEWTAWRVVTNVATQIKTQSVCTSRERPLVFPLVALNGPRWMLKTGIDVADT